MEYERWNEVDISTWVNELIVTWPNNEYLKEVAIRWSSAYLHDEKIEDKELAYLAVVGISDKVGELNFDGYGDGPRRVLNGLYEYLGRDEGYNINIEQFGLSHHSEEASTKEAEEILDWAAECERGVSNRDKSVFILKDQIGEMQRSKYDAIWVQCVSMLRLGRNGNPEYVSEPLHDRLMERVPGFKERWEEIHLTKQMKWLVGTKRVKI